MKAIILSDGIPGHFNQSIGIASLISEEIPIKYKIVESKLTFNIFRSLFMQYQKFLAKKFNDKNAQKIINMHQKICVDDIDLIISCGKKVAYHSAAISKVSSIINIHAGSVNNIDLKNFSVHITGEAVENSPNNVSSVIAPTKCKPVIRKSQKTNKVLFLIGGDGAGMSQLKELVEKYNLHARVELLGGLPHNQVRDVLCRGHIFLNTSLTESFCIAILEAACCGLLVVTTDVGGVPEVLPPHMAYLAHPDEKSILRQIRKAVMNVKTTKTDNFYNEVASIYSWRQVAERTERVYDYAMSKQVPNVMARVKNSFVWGPIVGAWAVFYTIIEGIVMLITDILYPE